MLKWVAYPLSIIYYSIFMLLLWVFHPIQIVCLHLFGQRAQNKAVNALNYLLLLALKIVGTRVVVSIQGKLPKDRLLIFAANHQSTYDIPPLIWYLRKYSPKFIAKKELGKGFPSISYHLRNGGNVLIDRKEPAKSIAAITQFCQQVQQLNEAVVIFPEGTRSRDGRIKPFQKAGLHSLLQEIPKAMLVPVCIRNSWKLGQWNYFPLPVGVNIELRVLPPIDPTLQTAKESIDQLERTIANQLKN